MRVAGSEARAENGARIEGRARAAIEEASKANEVVLSLRLLMLLPQRLPTLCPTGVRI